MTKADFSINKEEKNEIEISTSNIIEDLKTNRSIKLNDLKDVTKLLEINEDNFKKYQAETWFKKAWIIVSGKKGAFTDINIINLGKIQNSVVRLLSQILDNSSEMKMDIIKLFEYTSELEIKNQELKVIILAFNKKYREEFIKINKTVKRHNFILINLLLIVTFILCVISIQILDPDIFQQQLRPISILSISLSLYLLLMIGYSFFTLKKKSKQLQIGKINIAQKNKSFKKNENLNNSIDQLGLSEQTEGNNDFDKRIFKIKKEVNETLDFFSLDDEERRLLFSLHYQIINSDIKITEDLKDKAYKKKWLSKWLQIIEKSTIENSLVQNYSDLENGILELIKDNYPIEKILIILFEMKLFIPYYPLTPKEKKLEVKYSIDNGAKVVKNLCQKIEINYSYILEAEKKYNQALEEIPPGFWNWERFGYAIGAAILIGITGGVAAPFIGTAIGGILGLSGAAATSAGLAFLGGGAIAAGGLGMAGGTAVLIGGGAILGSGLSAGIMAYLTESKDLVLRELAKIDGLSRILTKNLENPDRYLEDVIRKIIDMQENLENQIEAESSKKSDIKISIEYCKREIERLSSFSKNRNS